MGAQCSRSLGSQAALTLALWVTPWGRQRLWSTKPMSTLIPVTFRVNLSAAGPSHHVSHLCPKTDVFNISRWRETGREAGCFSDEVKNMVWDSLCLLFFSFFRILFAELKERFQITNITPGIAHCCIHHIQLGRTRNINNVSVFKSVFLSTEKLKFLLNFCLDTMI